MSNQSELVDTKTTHHAIAAFGDSIVQGRLALPGRGWVHQFCEALYDVVDRDTLFTAASGGNNSSRVVLDVSGHKHIRCDYAVLGVGVNDSRYRPSLGGHEVGIEEYAENIRLIVDGLSRITRVAIVVTGLAPVVDRLTNPLKADKYAHRHDVQRYDAQLQDVCSSLEVRRLVFVPLFNEWMSKGEAFIESHLADGLHPNTPGHTFIANIVMDTVEAVKLTWPASEY